MSTSLRQLGQKSCDGATEALAAVLRKSRYPSDLLTIRHDMTRIVYGSAQAGSRALAERVNASIPRATS